MYQSDLMHMFREKKYQGRKSPSSYALYNLTRRPVFQNASSVSECLVTGKRELRGSSIKGKMTDILANKIRRSPHVAAP